VGFYRFVRGITDNIDDAYDNLVAKISQVSRRIFNGNRVVTSFTGSPDARARFWDAAGDMRLAHLAGAEAAPRLEVPAPVALSEAFVVPANVCFVAQAVIIGPQVPRLTGSWIVASRALSLDYLWNEVRVKGGAYGCGSSVTMSGRLRFHSYRDPAVDPTLERFARSAEWLAEWNPTRDELEGYIVSSVAKRDAPQKPRELARHQDTRRFAGITEDLRTTLRDELLACTPEQVRALAVPLQDAIPRLATCVFGGKDQIAASNAGLQVVELF
jgi:Zn-dependent M16 (insulinase) family peptidase